MPELARMSGVPARSLRHWVRARLLPKPIGAGRGARYDERHLLRARAVLYMRAKTRSLEVVRERIDRLTHAEIVSFVEAHEQRAAGGVPAPPREPAYPHATWEVVTLMDGMLLMVDPSKGAVLRRIADEIHRHYSVKSASLPR